MYINPHEAMQLLQITTRQGLHKVVKNHNITVKSQGAGKPNLYLKSDLERYMKDNAKNIKIRKNPQVIKKAEKIKKDRTKKIEKHLKVKQQVKKEVDTEIEKDFKVTEQSNENWTVIRGKENIDKALKEFQEKDIKEIKEKKEKEIKKDLELPNDEEIESPLNKVGMAEFQRVTDLLIEQGTYKEVDRALVLAYAISYQKYIFSTVASAKQDDTTMNEFGDLKVHPYFQVAKESFNQMEKVAKLLGIGARSRVGLDIKEKKKESFLKTIMSKNKFDD